MSDGSSHSRQSTLVSIEGEARVLGKARAANR